jgi:hypothetical protein
MNCKSDEASNFAGREVGEVVVEGRSIACIAMEYANARTPPRGYPQAAFDSIDY